MDKKEVKPILASIFPDGPIDSVSQCDCLEEALRLLIKEGLVQETHVEAAEHPMQEEHWYQEIATGYVYRYVPPNFPARGYWGKVRPDVLVTRQAKPGEGG